VPCGFDDVSTTRPESFRPQFRESSIRCVDCSAMVLSDGTIKAEIEAGRIVIDPYEPDNIQPASIDLRLGDFAYPVTTSFLPGRGMNVLDKMKRLDDELLAMKAAGEFLDRSLEREITESLRHADAEVRFAAAWSGTLSEIAESGARHARDGAALVARRMDAGAAASWQKRLAGSPKLLRLGIVVAGAIGDPAFLPWLMSLMGELPLARLAGESFTMITGMDLAYRDLERKPPPDLLRDCSCVTHPARPSRPAPGLGACSSAVAGVIVHALFWRNLENIATPGWLALGKLLGSAPVEPG